MIDQCERVFAEPISSAIKKSQSSPLTQKLYWHDYQTDAHPHCTKRPLQTHRQRRFEHDRYLFRMKGDAANSELTNEDIVACSKYARAIPVKSSIKKHRHCKQPEVLILHSSTKNCPYSTILKEKHNLIILLEAFIIFILFKEATRFADYLCSLIYC